MGNFNGYRGRRVLEQYEIELRLVGVEGYEEGGLFVGDLDDDDFALSLSGEAQRSRNDSASSRKLLAKSVAQRVGR